ncbi:MAG TPA: hypothetical protein VGM30_05410 [Puia sp.]|jgi:hypothetical protein
MKKMYIPLLAGLALCCLRQPVLAQEFKEHITKELTPSKSPGSVLCIYNFSGFIKVEGYSGDKVLLEIDKTISADDTADLEVGKKEVRLEFEQREDSIIGYIADPWDMRPRKRYNRWNEDRDIHYRFNLEFTIKVPFSMNLVVSTINRGAITVKDVAGNMRVNNVNGPVTVTQAKGVIMANTVNGAVNVSYVSNPPAASSYRTVNGNITVSYQPGLSADLQFKSMNGSYYTDFPQVEILPPMILRNTEKGDNGVVYKISARTAVRVGAGGLTHHFETLNGNIYIKKQS